MKRTNEMMESSLRRARKRLGMSQERAAAEIGCSLSHYQTMEREPRLISRTMAPRIVRVLGVTPGTMKTAPHAREEGR